MPEEKVQPDEVYAFIANALRSGTSAEVIREEVEAAIRHHAYTFSGFCQRMESLDA